jgi:hypothetical protein
MESKRCAAMGAFDRNKKPRDKRRNYALVVVLLPPVVLLYAASAVLKPAVAFLPRSAVAGGRCQQLIRSQNCIPNCIHNSIQNNNDNEAAAESRTNSYKLSSFEASTATTYYSPNVPLDEHNHNYYNPTNDGDSGDTTTIRDSINEYSFFDEAIIHVRAGSGGQGASTYKKGSSSSSSQDGPPDGGNGGTGGTAQCLWWGGNCCDDETTPILSSREWSGWRSAIQKWAVW